MAIDEAVIVTDTPKSFRQKVVDLISPSLPYLTIMFLVVLFCSVYFYQRIIITINPGEAGVLYRRFYGGTQVDHVYGEGIQLIFPWDRMYIYNVRKQVVPHQFDVLTKTGLPITVGLTIRYNPEYDLVGILHQNVGPDYVKVTVIPVIESTIRSLLGQYNAEEVYTTKRAVVQQIINESLEQASRKYVIIDDVLITKIELPQAIREAIEVKLEEDQKYQAYEFINKREKEEAERKRIEAGGIRDYQRIINETLTDKVLLERGIKATEKLAQSKNTKVIVIGAGEKGLPLILGK